MTNNSFSIQGLKHRISIIGPLQVQNELLCQYLSEQMKDCIVGIGAIPTGNPAAVAEGAGILTLVDWKGKDVRAIAGELQPIDAERDSRRFMMLFNVHPKLMEAIEADAFSFGISGIFFEDTSLETFTKGVRAVLEGELWFSRRAMTRLIRNRQVEPVSHANDKASLTPREKEIIRWLALGHKNSEIADALNISRHTIKTHVYNIYKKIDVPNRFQAVLWASQHLSLNALSRDLRSKESEH